jgi:hypothetical protein
MTLTSAVCQDNAINWQPRLFLNRPDPRNSPAALKVRKNPASVLKHSMRLSWATSRRPAYQTALGTKVSSGEPMVCILRLLLTPKSDHSNSSGTGSTTLHMVPSQRCLTQCVDTIQRLICATARQTFGDTFQRTHHLLHRVVWLIR